MDMETAGDERQMKLDLAGFYMSSQTFFSFATNKMSVTTHHNTVREGFKEEGSKNSVSER